MRNLNINVNIAGRHKLIEEEPTKPSQCSAGVEHIPPIPTCPFQSRITLNTLSFRFPFVENGKHFALNTRWRDRRWDGMGIWGCCEPWIKNKKRRQRSFNAIKVVERSCNCFKFPGIERSKPFPPKKYWYGINVRVESLWRHTLITLLNIYTKWIIRIQLEDIRLITSLSFYWLNGGLRIDLLDEWWLEVVSGCIPNEQSGQRWRHNWIFESFRSYALTHPSIYIFVQCQILLFPTNS